MSSNLVPFPTASASHAAAGFLSDPGTHSHAVQFYESDAFLVTTVASFLTPGLRNDERMVVIATPEHRQAFVAHLPHPEVERALEDGRLMMLDARQSLARFMVGGMPDPDLFRNFITGVISALQDGSQRARIRAYGEMVDLLWRDGNSRAAIRLEELWNDAGNEHAFALLCAYVMGNFYKEGETSQFMEVCRVHSHVIPTERFTQLEDPHARLREISLLQQRARALESEIAHRKDLEHALREALRDRSRVEEDLRACVKREKEAREQAEANDSYKEMFLGILGHDLRNPLNTVLTTARMMKLRGDLDPENGKRVDRMVSSGARMERMITQLLDVTRARLSDGIAVNRAQQHDLAAIVRKIVEELSAAHPGRRIRVSSAGAALAYLDPDRLEQVISNLVGNALTHGDPTTPITVSVGLRAGMASLSVHNFGPPIDPQLVSQLFNPFQRREQADNLAGGLGLGLYIAERIVTAHAGTITVESSAEGGTSFVVCFPARSEDV